MSTTELAEHVEAALSLCTIAFTSVETLRNSGSQASIISSLIDSLWPTIRPIIIKQHSPKMTSPLRVISKRQPMPSGELSKKDDRDLPTKARRLVFQVMLDSYIGLHAQTMLENAQMKKAQEIWNPLAVLVQRMRCRPRPGFITPGWLKFSSQLSQLSSVSNYVAPRLASRLASGK